MTPDRRPSDGNNTSAPNGNAANNTADPSATSAPTATTETPRGQPTITSQQIRPNVHEIRIDSFPIDVRNISRHPAYINMLQHVQQDMRRQHSNNNSTHSQNQTATNDANTPPSNDNTPSPDQQTLPENGQPQRPQEPVVGNLNTPVFLNNMNPNMEFFMEVTPESITIDSLETTVVTSAAQADNGEFVY